MSGTAWAVVRVVLYALICVTSLVVAGIVGTVAYHNFSPGCLLAVKLESADKSVCAGGACRVDTDCDAGWTCDRPSAKCVPFGDCIAITNAGDTSSCEYCVVAGVAGGMVALLFCSLNIFCLLRRNTSYFKKSCWTVLLLVLAGAWVILAIAYSAVITKALSDLCKSIDGYPGQSCTSFRIPDAQGNELLPSFYEKLRTAAICGWVSAAAWLAIAVLAALRIFCSKGAAEEAAPNDEDQLAPANAPLIKDKGGPDTA